MFIGLSLPCRSLRPCLSHLIRVVIVFSEHENSDMRYIANGCVDSLKESSLQDQCSVVWNDLQDDLVNSFEALASTVESGRESAVIASFKLCCGYVKLFGEIIAYVYLESR